MGRYLTIAAHKNPNAMASVGGLIGATDNGSLNSTGVERCSFENPATKETKETKDVPVSPTSGENEYVASMRRLDSAYISIAVLDDGTIRIVTVGLQLRQAVKEGFTIYSPQDAYYFVRLTPDERRIFHNLKRTFGGSSDWNERGDQ